jgi:predicted PurR-regulated permease PerM
MKNKFLEALLILIGIGIALYFMFEIRSIVIYLLLATVLSAIGNPIVTFISKHKFKNISVPRSIATVITLAMFLGVFFAIAASLIPLIEEQSKNLSLVNIAHIEQNFHESIHHLNSILDEIGIGAIDLHKDFSLGKVLNFSFIPEILNNIIGALGDFTIALFTITFISFFLMKDRSQIIELISNLFSKEMAEHLRTIGIHTKKVLARYIAGLFIQIIILFTFYSILLYFIGVENFIVIALIGAILNLIPYVGPLIGMVLVNLLSITSHLNDDFYLVIFPMVIKITVGYIFVQIIDNFVNQPIIFSKSANAHPLEVFLVILIAGQLFGISGMIVAVPAYTVMRIILKEFFRNNEIVQTLTKNV